MTAELIIGKNEPAYVSSAKGTLPAGGPPIGPAYGDLSGAYPAPTVQGIQGRSVTDVAPADLEFLGWEAAGSRWLPLQLQISYVNGLQTALDGKENTGVAAGLVSAHEAKADPHPQYNDRSLHTGTQDQSTINRLSAISATQAESLTYVDGEIIKVKDVYDAANDMYYNLIYYFNPDSEAVIDGLEVLGVANPSGRLLLIDACACNVFTKNNSDYFKGHTVEDQLQEAGFDLYEISQDTSLNNFEVTESVDNGVWTVTITQTEGDNIVFNLGRVRYETSTPSLSVDATPYAGTDISPKEVYIYVTVVAGEAVLVASNITPEGNIDHHIDCRLFVTGSIGLTSKTDYSCLSEIVTSGGSLSAMWHTMLEQGPQYRQGLGFSATSTEVNIDSGEVRVVWDRLITDAVSSQDGFFHILFNGNFINDKTSFEFTEYSDGVIVGAGKYVNVTICMVLNEPTRMMAIVQGSASPEYTSAALALNDSQSRAVIKPSASQKILNFAILPICTVIARNDGAGLLHAVDGEYAFQVSGSTGSSAGTAVPNHAATHVDGTDDIQDATALQKGLMSAAQVAILEQLNTYVNQDVTITGTPVFAGMAVGRPALPPTAFFATGGETIGDGLVDLYLGAQDASVGTGGLVVISAGSGPSGDGIVNIIGAVSIADFLQGEILIKGLGNTSATYAAIFKNSDGTDIAAFRNDGAIGGEYIDLLESSSDSIYLGTDNGDRSAVNNVIIGSGAGSAGTPSSIKRTIMGTGAGSITTGADITAYGYNAGRRGATAFGSQAAANGGTSTTAAFGLNSLLNVTTGQGANTSAYGYSSGRYYGSGASSLQNVSDSLYLGALSRAKEDGVTNEVVIGGIDAVGNGSNTTTIGNSSVADTYLAGNVRNTGGYYKKVTDVATTTYTVLSSDYTVSVSHSAAAAETITLPPLSSAWDATTSTGQVVVIKDSAGDAGTYTITINVDDSGTETIDGSTSVSITSNYGTVRLQAISATKWIVC